MKVRDVKRPDVAAMMKKMAVARMRQDDRVR
jgi:hypothetical protein